MKVMRTPDVRFEDLPGYAFAPHYVVVDADRDSSEPLRMHYLDEGPRSAPVVLMLHCSELRLRA